MESASFSPLHTVLDISCFLYSVVLLNVQSPACSSLSNQRYCLLSELFSPFTCSPHPQLLRSWPLTLLKEIICISGSTAAGRVWTVLGKTDSGPQRAWRGSHREGVLALCSLHLKAALQSTPWLGMKNRQEHNITVIKTQAFVRISIVRIANKVMT